MYNLKTTPIQDGPILKTYPFADKGVNSAVIAIPYSVENDYYSPATLNSVISSSYYCVGDQNISVTDGVKKYSRVYAQVPADVYDYSTVSATFPGIYGPVRNPFTRTVPSIIENEFFLVGSGGSYSTAADIPVISAQTYSYNGFTVDVTDYYLGNPAGNISTASYFALGNNLVVEDSNISQWQGNIFKRETTKVKAI